MPVIFDNLANSIQTSTVSCTVTLTVGSNAVLLACFIVNSLTQSLSAVAYAGNALTKLGSVNISAGTGVSLHLWGLTAPPAGVANLSANIAGAAVLFEVAALTYTGAKASAPFGTLVTGSISAVSTLNTSFSSSTTDMVVMFAASNADLQPNNGTLRLHDAAHFGYLVVDTVGATTISLSATASAGTGPGNICFLGVNVIFSAAAAGSLFYGLAQLGVGA